MLETLGAILRLAALTSAAIVGFAVARNFVRRRLRFVDAVQSPLAPIIAGAGALLLAMPATLLPFVSGWTAWVFGIAVGAGTASGARDLRRGEWRELPR